MIDKSSDKTSDKKTLTLEPLPEPVSDQPPVAPPDPVISETVTYLPAVEDPVQTRFAGHTFHANLPKTIDMKTSFFERLRGNRFFKVGPFDAAKEAVKLSEQPKQPRTSDEYKVHAVRWFKSVQNLHEFDDRWVAEETLRQDCDVGADDLDYLMSLARPKRGDLEKKLRP